MSYEKKTRTKQKPIRLDQSVIQSIQKMAEDDNRTFNNMVETILLNASRQRKMI